MSPSPASAATDIYLPQPATIVAAQAATALEMLFDLRLESGAALGHQPGQFVEVSLGGIGEAPISICSSPTRPGGFQLLVRRVGNLTTALHRLAAGGRVGIRGPFGRPFPVATDLRGRDVLFICGGIGLAPVRSAIQYVLDRRADYGAVTILFGAKSPAERLFQDELAAWPRQPGTQVLEAVDRADEHWRGHVGVITTLMPKIRLYPRRTVAVVCGPPIMYKFVLMELHKLELADNQIFVSLERHMKCGVGKCGHCQINGLYACQDGPVFRYSDLAAVGEAFR